MRQNTLQLPLFLDNWLIESDLSKHGLGTWRYGSNLVNKIFDSLFHAQHFISMHSSTHSDVQLQNRARVQTNEDGYGFDLIGYKIDVEGVQEWRNIGFRTVFTPKVYFGFPEVVFNENKIKLYAPDDSRCLYSIDFL